LAFIVLLAARSGDDAGRSRRDISDFANTGTHFAWTASPIRHEVGSSRLKVAAELDL
jgi:hypothetical protein